ncbi:MAG: M28 family peptidase [Novosphingobium sp.]|nr:M28 family peptidase [Novosphingobium sp.]
MRRFVRNLALAALVLPGAAIAAPAPAEGDAAWDFIAGLTSEVGQRLAGSEAEARGRAWAAEKLKALGFRNVAIEPAVTRAYVRGTDAARLVSPVPQQLAVTALGFSGTTPDAGIEADVVYFASLADLKAVPAGSLTGKIVFLDHAMKAAQDGSGYGPYGQARREGPAVASTKGAMAIVIRSIGTDSHRNPHTGATIFPAGTAPIPAAAMSNPDADLLLRLIGKGRALRLALTLTGRTAQSLPTGNVIGDLPGRDPALPPILVACHLDSWDLGTGAIDDGAGCAIVTAAALKAQSSGPTLRTIRVAMAGAEEIGAAGGAAYAKAHPERHALAMESDSGADRVWRVAMKFAPANAALADRVAAALAPLGIVRGKGEVEGGADVAPVIAAQKLAVIDLDQDMTHYFDLHHTPDDTLDKIDRGALSQNVAAWAAVLGVVANAPEEIAPAG